MPASFCKSLGCLVIGIFSRQCQAAMRKALHQYRVSQQRGRMGRPLLYIKIADETVFLMANQLACRSTVRRAKDRKACRARFIQYYAPRIPTCRKEEHPARAI